MIIIRYSNIFGSHDQNYQENYQVFPQELLNVFW